MRVFKLFFIYAFFIVLSNATLAQDSTLDKEDLGPAYGDTIIVGSIGEPSILIPMLASDSASHEVAGLFFNGLVKYDKDLTLIGDLADSWDISDDGLVITFHLKQAILFE